MKSPIRGQNVCMYKCINEGSLKCRVGVCPQQYIYKLIAFKWLGQSHFFLYCSVKEKMMKSRLRAPTNQGASKLVST